MKLYCRLLSQSKNLTDVQIISPECVVPRIAELFAHEVVEQLTVLKNVFGDLVTEAVPPGPQQTYQRMRSSACQLKFSPHNCRSEL